MSELSARELIKAIRERDDTDAAIIGTNLGERVEKVLALPMREAGYQRAAGWNDCLDYVRRLLNGEAGGQRRGGVSNG